MALEDYNTYLHEQLESLDLPQKELTHRCAALTQALNNSTKVKIDTRYYNLAHEIKALHFLRKFGEIEPALDYKHTDGCDVILEDRYQIEFVCTSPGEKENKSEYDRLTVRNKKGFILGDYTEKERFLFTRITNALKNKRIFYNEHVEKGTISKDKPYLVFLGLGELAIDMFCGDYGIDLTGVLLGKGCPTITISGDGKVINRGYTHNENFPKYNGATIDCNLFCQEEYRCISGVIFSEADLFTDYTTQNTWLFLNPFAKNKIRKKDFPGMVYWSANKYGDYSPRRNGKRI